MLTIEQVVSLECLLLLSGFPNAIPITVPLLEITLIDTSISPSILSESFRQSIDKLTNVFVSISIAFTATTMFEAIFELSRIKIT